MLPASDTAFFGGGAEGIPWRIYPQAALLYGSATILGPLGLAAALRSIFSKSAAMNRAAIAALCLLAAWTLAAYSVQLLTFGQTHLSDWWREFVLIAVLPILAVAHVAFINSQSLSSRAPT